jgi:hypothetical protein
VLAVLARVSDWIAKRRVGKCFEKLKYEQHGLGFTRFYLTTKCPELGTLSPDWKRLAYLFHLHHTSIGPDDHMVIHFLRWLQS